MAAKPGKTVTIDGGALTELGTTGLRRTRSGLVYEEIAPKLKGKQARKTYAEMTLHPIVASILFAVDMLMRQVPWSVVRGGESPDDEGAADFLSSCMDDMSSPWGSFIAEALSMLPFGFAPHEICYKRRLGPNQSDPTKRSKFNDGRIGWRKLPVRGQETIHHWEFAEDGGLLGLVQRDPLTGRMIPIPVEKLLLFRTTEERGNPEGRSILRSGYSPWYFMTRIERIEAIGIERDLAGLPVYEVPARILDVNASAEDKALLEHIKNTIRNVRRDAEDGAVVPLEYDEKGNPLWKFSLLSTGGRRQFDTNETVMRWARMLAMTVLADFILLGHEKVGSFALQSSKTELFALAIGAWLDAIADVLNRFAVPRLFRMNNFSLEALPTIAHGDIETPDLDQLGRFITALAGAGFPLFPDDELESWVRRAAGMPTKTEDH